MNEMMSTTRSAGPFQDNCYEIRLTGEDLERFGLDTDEVLLELRPKRGEYGVFYNAKGRQWDVWYDPEDEDAPRRAIAFALEDPITAACELLAREWRPDFAYDPDAEDD